MPSNGAGNRDGTYRAAENGYEIIHRKEVEVSKFETDEAAKSFAEKIRGSGFDTAIRSETVEDQKTIYRVFMLIHGGDSRKAPPSIPPGGVATVERAATASPEESPIGVSKNRLEFSERKLGFLHASLSITGIYTDNAFNTRNDKKSDFSTILTPAIWISLPTASRENMIIEDTSTRSPGGLILNRSTVEVFRRYRIYSLYQTDIPLSSVNSPSGNTVGHRFQGILTYNLRGGLSANLIDQFIRSYEARGTGLTSLRPEEVDRYYTNLVNAVLSYDTGRRLKLRLDYANYILNYDSSGNRFRERTDNTLSAYIFYRIMSKTDLFLQYTFIDIAYGDNDLNSREQHFLGGLQWDITAKSKGSIRAGYGIKDLSGSTVKGNNFIFEARIDHKFTPKTSLSLTGFRKTLETDLAGTFFMLSTGMEAKYQQMLTPKITGAVNLLYSRDEYVGDFNFGNETGERADNIYRASFTLQYEFRRWLKGSAGYSFSARDSNFSDFSYENNTVFFRITGGL